MIFIFIPIKHADWHIVCKPHNNIIIIILNVSLLFIFIIPNKPLNIGPINNAFKLFKLFGFDKKYNNSIPTLYILLHDLSFNLTWKNLFISLRVDCINIFILLLLLSCNCLYWYIL